MLSSQQCLRVKHAVFSLWNNEKDNISVGGVLRNYRRDYRDAACFWADASGEELLGTPCRRSELQTSPTNYAVILIIKRLGRLLAHLNMIIDPPSTNSL